MNKDRVQRIKEIIKKEYLELMESRKRCFPVEYELAMKELEQEKEFAQEQKAGNILV